MKRAWAYMLLAAMAMLASAHDLQAQASVRVQLYWQWNDGAWRPHRYDWDARARDYFLPRPGLRIAVGFLPPPGYCREWIPGVAPAYQPPPVQCDDLFLPYGYARAGVLILGSPGYDGPPAWSAGLRWRSFDRMRIARDRAEREHRAWARAMSHRSAYERSGRTARYKAPARNERGRARDHRDHRDDRGHRDREHGRGRGG